MYKYIYIYMYTHKYVRIYIYMCHIRETFAIHQAWYYLVSIFFLCLNPFPSHIQNLIHSGKALSNFLIAFKNSSISHVLPNLFERCSRSNYFCVMSEKFLLPYSRIDKFRMCLQRFMRCVSKCCRFCMFKHFRPCLLASVARHRVKCMGKFLSGWK